MFRLLWLTFFGASRMDPETEHHVHESPLSMTSVLVTLAVLSAIGGFLSIPHFLEPQLPIPQVPEASEHLEAPLMVVSIVLAFLGLAGAAYFFGGDGKRANRVAEHARGLHRLLSNKYYVDEIYDRLIGKPLYWISDRVFFDLGDHRIIDGTLHGFAALGRSTAGVLARIQTGNLHLYAWLVLAGIALALVWSSTHG